MKYLYKLIFLLPLFIIALELIFAKSIFQTTQLNPVSTKNETISNFTHLLNQANIDYSDLILNYNNSEIFITIKNDNNYPFTTVFSTNKNTLSQVNALQKLLKIANIKGKEIKFIDLSSSRPYATL